MNFLTSKKNTVNTKFQISHYLLLICILKWKKRNQIPSLSDYDMTKDREKDIRFHDKTDYDIKLALNVSDYHAFVKDMAQLASVAIKKIKDNDEPKKRI